MDNTEAGIISGLFPVIKQALGLSLGALGVLTAAGKLVGVVTTPLWVWAATRWSRKGVLVICAGLWGVWSIALGFSQNFAQLLIFSTILSAGFVGATPIVTEIISDLFDTRSRGRAVGLFYGVIALASSLVAVLKGQLAGVEDGWRWGLWVLGVLGIGYGLVLWRGLRDPGRGASEPELAGLDRAEREAASRLTWGKAMALLKIPTFRVLLVSRLLSGHLLVLSFGVVYLVDVYGFTTQTASLVLLPGGVGIFTGNLLGGFLGDRATRRSPAHGLPALLQIAQILFAVFAFFGTQFSYGGIGLYALFFGFMGLAQGLNPGINRPMVMAVVPPGLRSAAFTIYVSYFEAAAWAVFGLGAGFLGDRIGLRPVFLVALVLLMLVNGLFLSLLHRTYGRDAERMRSELELRRVEMNR
ncbi:hypothetical protein BU197_29490 [Streptomyces sp. CBMA291]|nr:hypothetical protein [Streptomyces sp. CBMA291]MBD0716705.1 hypothetical protein [Streptomyces sp. CBMA370]